MGSNNIRCLISVILLHIMFIIPCVQGQSSSYYSSDSLDSFIHDYALMTRGKIRTGTLHNISLPANYSGIEASIIRLRSGNLWRRGANVSFFDIPPRTLPHPYSQRIILVFQNLGNHSALYYKVPNHTFVTPVIGLLAYDANTSLKNSGKVELNTTKDPILVHFPEFSGVEDSRDSTMRCVRFGANGEVEFSNVTMTRKCTAHGHGHFSIVIPSVPPVPSPSSKKKVRIWKWWVIGFGVGIGGLVLLVVFGILLCKLIRVKKIGKMERQSEKGEALDTVWVGSSRMPSASGIRTQPALENSYVP